MILTLRWQMALEQENFFTSGIYLKNEDSTQINMEGIFSLSPDFLSGAWHSASLRNGTRTYITTQSRQRCRNCQRHRQSRRWSFLEVWTSWWVREVAEPRTALAWPTFWPVSFLLDFSCGLDAFLCQYQPCRMIRWTIFATPSFPFWNSNRRYCRLSAHACFENTVPRF